MKLLTRDAKSEKPTAPLVDNDQLASSASGDIESQGQDAPHLLILRARARRVSTTTTLCLLLTALLVVGVGIIGGTYLYRQYLRSQIFKGWCSIPYDNRKAEMLLSDDFINSLNIQDDNTDMDDNFSEEMKNRFPEKFEIDVDNEEYEKIDVPDFHDGRSSRFIHDFKMNKTGIVDVGGKRCFVMALNRDNVLPPKSLSDLVFKMWEGYYQVDTEVIRETMRVVTPAISDTSEVGEYISNECNPYPIYRLEKYVGGVVKRSADLFGDDVKFAQFAGKGILEYDIVNMKELEAFEEKSK